MAQPIEQHYIEVILGYLIDKDQLNNAFLLQSAHSQCKTKEIKRCKIEADSNDPKLN